MNKTDYITPIVTPLTAAGELDETGLEALVNYIIEGGVSGILALGSIGEFFAFPSEFKKRLIADTVKFAAGRVPVLAGVSGTVLSEIEDLGKFALKAGAHAIISVPPYYFPHTQRDIYLFYSRLSKLGPTYLYNFPDRTGYSIDAETVLKIKRDCPSVLGIKDTLSGVDHTREIIKAVKGEFPEFKVYSGFDDNLARNVLSGGDGCIAGLSNALPEFCARWARALTNNDLSEAASCQKICDRLMDIYNVGKPFVPFIKAATRLMGVNITTRCSFPMPEVSKADESKILSIIQSAGV